MSEDDGVLADSEIIRRCQIGQVHWMEELVERYQTGLYSLCRRLAGNRSDADDLFQDTWANALRRIDSYDPERRFPAWLFAICINRYRDQQRRRRRWWRRIKPYTSAERLERTINQHPTGNPDPAQQAVSADRRAAVARTLGELGDRDRVPILLHYFHGCSMEEIGEILGIAPGTVKSRLFAARQRLGTKLEEAGHG